MRTHSLLHVQSFPVFGDQLGNILKAPLSLSPSPPWWCRFSEGAFGKVCVCVWGGVLVRCYPAEGATGIYCRVWGRMLNFLKVWDSLEQ